MPKLSGSLPKYRLHKRSGQAVVTLAGRDHYLGPYGTRASRIEYDRVIGEWVTAGRPTYVTATTNDITVVELIARYWIFAKGYYRKDGKPTRTLDNVQRALKPLRALYGGQPAVSFGPLALKSLQQRLIHFGCRLGDNVDESRPMPSRRFVNDCVDVIRRMFKWAASEELIPVTVYQALATVAGLRKGRTNARETGPVQPVDDAIIDATLPHLPPVVADMVRLQRATGARPGEVCSMRPADLDRSSDVWRYVPSTHKTEHFGRQRVIFIGPKAQVVLAPYLLRDAESFCFSPADSERKRRTEAHARRRTPPSCGNTIGTNRSTKPKRTPKSSYGKDAYARAIARACRKASVESWSPNQLRHTAATEIRRQFGLEAAQVALGHARADVTQVYAERDMTLAERIAKEVG